jgi:hypothetical protein
VLPGIAQVDVRSESAAVTNVQVQATLWEAGAEAAPAPVKAAAVAGQANLFNAAVWLFRNGSYSLRIRVEGGEGAGVAVVPLTSAATRKPTMSPPMRATLFSLGIFLFVSAVWLAGAAARDCGAATPSQGGPRETRRGRIAIACAIVLLTGGVYATTVRWQKLDREFRNNALYKPIPVAANVVTNGTLKILRITAPPPQNIGAQTWDTLVADHGKLAHLFLLLQPDYNAFAHLHPVRRDSRRFESVLPPLPGGAYQLYAEITYENGLNQTLIANLVLPGPTGRAPQLAGSNMEVFCQSGIIIPGNSPTPFALDPDDSWHGGGATPIAGQLPVPVRKDVGGSVSPLMGGSSMRFENADALVENRDTTLRFALFDSNGQPAKLEPYMGMAGHAVVRRSDGEVFTHLHPVGTISMAAQEVFLRQEQSEPSDRQKVLPDWQGPQAVQGNQLSFPYAFPRSGDYRMWVQARLAGKVLTGVFDVRVKPAP